MIDGRTEGRTDGRTDERTDGWRDGRTEGDGRTDGPTEGDGRTDGRDGRMDMDRQTNGRTIRRTEGHGRTDGWMDGRRDMYGRMNERTDGRTNIDRRRTCTCGQFHVNRVRCRPRVIPASLRRVLQHYTGRHLQTGSKSTGRHHTGLTTERTASCGLTVTRQDDVRPARLSADRPLVLASQTIARGVRLLIT